MAKLDIVKEEGNRVGLKREAINNLNSGLTARYLDYIHLILMPKIFRGDDVRIRLTRILFNKDYKKYVELRYNAIDIIEGINLEHKKKPSMLLNSIRASLASIAKYDSELAFKLNGIINPKDTRKTDQLVARIVQIVQKYEADVVYRYFRKYYREYKNALSRLKDTEIGKKIIDGIRGFLLKYAVKKKEIKTIKLFEAEVSGWNSVDLGEDIRRYIAQGAYYITILRSFKDPIIDSRFDDPRIKQLIRYYNEINLFYRILEQIEKGEHEGAWEDFEKFYKHVKEISDEVKNIFGDIRDANILLKLKEEFHESPEYWKKGINDIISGLEGRKGEIIFQAARAFDEFFKRDMERIKGAEARILEEFRNLLYSIEKENKSVVIKKVRRLIKEVRTRKKQLDAIIRLKRKRYKDEEGKIFLLRRAELIEQVVRMSEDQSVDKCINETETSFNELVKLVDPLRSISRILKSKNLGVEAAATARLIGFIAGGRAAEENIEDNSIMLKDILMKYFVDIIQNGNFLLRRNAQLVALLRRLIEEKNLNKLLSNREKGRIIGGKRLIA